MGFEEGQVVLDLRGFRRDVVLASVDLLGKLFLQVVRVEVLQRIREFGGNSAWRFARPSLSFLLQLANRATQRVGDFLELTLQVGDSAFEVSFPRGWFSSGITPLSRPLLAVSSG